MMPIKKSPPEPLYPLQPRGTWGYSWMGEDGFGDECGVGTIVVRSMDTNINILVHSLPIRYLVLSVLTAVTICFLHTVVFLCQN